MGRRPNPLILEYFVRGPKLNDNSNRYPHTCKQCGENFPKGRIDSLTTHITRKCPAISESDRMRACLELHGIASARAPPGRDHQGDLQTNGQPTAAAALAQGWSALETLAEASRQVDLNENSRGQKGQDNPANPAISDYLGDRFELQEQFTLDNPPVSYDGRQGIIKKGSAPPLSPAAELTPEERLQALLPASTPPPPDPSNISVAVAATARLNPSFLDPQLVDSDPPAASSPIADTAPALEPPQATIPEPNHTQPWGEITYITSTSPMAVLTDAPPVPLPLNRGGMRMDTSDSGLNGRPRNARSRFTPARRKEVQEVRKIGACIRCRILRKNCGKGTPCDTCRKVLSPRVWRTGCVRTRLHEQLDLYSAGVQVVLSQNRINALKAELQLSQNGTTIELSHFPDSGKNVTFATLVAMLPPSESQAAARDSKEPFSQTVMIDQDAEDIPEKVEQYMRDVLPLFIEKEPSNFMRSTLEIATKRVEDVDDELLRKALELWGLVESIDRERQWTILEKPGTTGEEPRWIRDTQNADEADIYTMICVQLNAGAERRANRTAMSLLNLMDRLLTDSKVRVGFNMFLTAVILLNCVEKFTWSFKAWEQDHLRPGWPLQREPGAYTHQGDNLAGLLRMLLAIRKALPQTLRGNNGKLASQDEDSAVVNYFQSVDLDFETVEARQKGPHFSPADSRSLELLYCSHLLLPNAAA